jgi:hypothetical protein
MATKNAAITVRLPELLKRRLAARAQRERRSLSAQVEYELERAVRDEPAGRPGSRFLGKYEGTRIPSEKDFAEVRALLWGRLADRSSRG